LFNLVPYSIINDEKNNLAELDILIYIRKRTRTKYLLIAQGPMSNHEYEYNEFRRNINPFWYKFAKEKKKKRKEQIQINIQLNSLLIEIERAKLENTIYYSITYIYIKCAV
jgi:hypothetical protein